MEIRFQNQQLSFKTDEHHQISLANDSLQFENRSYKNQILVSRLGTALSTQE